MKKNNCFGMIEWNAPLRWSGNTEPSPTLSKTDFHRCPKIAVQNKEMSMAPSSVVSLLGWLQPKHGYVLPSSRLQATFHGLVSKTHWKNSGCRQTTPARCRKIQIFSCAGQQNSLAQQTSGKVTMVKSSATRSWCRPIFKILMMPTTKLEQSEIRTRQMSSTTAQTWTQLFPSDKLTRCVCWPLSPLWPLEATLSESLWAPSIHRAPTPGQSRRHSSYA